MSWRLFLPMLPLMYFQLVTLPAPFGLHLQHGNDFNGHRIWWKALATPFLREGFVPLNNPAIEFGALYPGWRGHALLYVPNWWMQPVLALNRPGLQVLAEYISLTCHLSFAALGIFLILRRFAHVSRPASAVGVLLFLMNQRLHDSIRYPNAVEAMCWIPWMVYFTLKIIRCDAEEFSTRRRALWGDGLALAGVTMLSWLAGYGQMTYIGGLLVGCLMLTGSRTFKGVGWAGASLVAGSLLAAGSLYPTWLNAQMIPGRAGGDMGFALQQSMQHGYLRMFTNPFAENVHASLFFLPVLLLPILLGVVGGWKTGRWRMQLGMLLGALIIADLSRGGQGFLFTWAYDHLPMYRAFRVQGRNNWITMIALAWFAGIGMDHLLRASLPAKIAALSVVVTLSLWSFFAFPNPPGDFPEYAPYGFYGMDADGRVMLDGFLGHRNFGLLLLGGVIWLAGFLAFKSPAPRMLLLLMHCACFVFFFGRYSTFYRPWSTYEVRPDYAQGLLINPVLGYGRMSVPMVDENYQERLAAYASLVPPNSPFPDSRFCFVPDSAQDLSVAGPVLALRAFGPNHLSIDTRSQIMGHLLYFGAWMPGWKCNFPLTQGPKPFDDFMWIRLPPGVNRIELTFRPWGTIAACLLSLVAVFFLPATWLRLQGFARSSQLISSIGFICIAISMWGMLTRHAASDRLLFGGNIIPKENGAKVPVRSLPKEPTP